MSYFTTECSNPMDYTTTNYSILLQNIVVYREKNIFYHNASNFTTDCSNFNYTTTNCSILQQNIVVYHKK